MLLNYRKFLSLNILMATRNMFFKGTYLPRTQLLSSRTYSKLLFSNHPSKPTSKSSPFLIKSCGVSYTPHARAYSPVEVENEEVDAENSMRLSILNKKLENVGIGSGDWNPGQYHGLICPMCKGGNSGEKALSLLIEHDGNTATWTCHRAKCGWKGGLKALAGLKSSYKKMSGTTTVKKIRKITEHELNLQPLSDPIREFFSMRMISGETLRRNNVLRCTHDYKDAIAFTYRRKGELVGCKYRDENKKFWQESNTEKILYGLDDIDGATEIIIVEGEIDKLSMEEAGFRNCVSVPDGAPASVSKKEVPSEEQDTKYQYLWNCKEYLEKATRIILATDGDQPGQALAEELARRLGRERCWRIKWPKKKDDNEYYKDANEVLANLGPEALREVIDNAELYPIQGLYSFKDFTSEIDAYYHQTLDFQLGVSTGWRCLNEFYNVVPGELTIVTGVPNSGKSEWIDALLCNLCATVGWKFALCSMENKVRDHARKLMEKHVKKPFFVARYAESSEKMSPEEFEQGKQWLSDNFYLIRCENDSLPNIEWVLKKAKAAVQRYGINGLVIDPYNELDHQRPQFMTETEYVSVMLTKVKRFAQFHSCHVWFVAHPRQMHNWVGGPPSLYDISGSAHFINKCDNGIVIHRNRDLKNGPVDRVQVCVRKVRNKVAGTIGEAFLSYDRVTGQYVDSNNTCAVDP
ncbi:hypothetical protein ACET3Z_007900 [Daucus carota]